MANIVNPSLPADLPTDWSTEQYVSPNGTEVGLSRQHGYNYLMKQVNDAQKAVNTLAEQAQEVVTGLEIGAPTATATHSGTTVAITGPAGAQTVTFLAPSDWENGNSYTYNGKAITLTDLNNQPVVEGWKQGAPVTLYIQGSHAFFRAGGGVISDLPPLLPNMRVTVTKGSPKDTYAVKFDKLPDNAETDMLEKFFLTYSYSETPPEKPTASNTLSEKSKSEVLSSAVPPGTLSYIWTVPNDKTIIFRQFTQNAKKQLQTELKGAVWPPVVDPWQLPKFTGNHTIFGDEQSGRIELYESGTLTLSPGVYDFFAVGGGGAGGTGLRNNRASGGGGGGGYTATVLKKAIAEKSVFAVVVGAGLLGTANDSEPEKQASSSTITGIITAKGGWRPNSSTSGESNRSQGGDGGSGGGGGVSAYAEKYTAGDGGSDGSDGQKGTNSGTGYPAGTGQGSTTRAFGNMALYAGGGGGGRSGYSSSSNTYSATAGAGGAGGGGGGDTKGSPLPGTPNTGGGGGGMRGYQATGNSGASAGAGAAGGSGIVIIRWGYTN